MPQSWFADVFTSETKKIEKEKKKQLDLEAAKLILIKIAEDKKAGEECDPTKKILYSTRRSLKGEYLRSVHESMTWKLFEKIHDEKGSRIDLIAVGAEAPPQQVTENNLCSESDSSVSELSVALSSNEEVCPKIDTCRRGSRSEQKARDAHRGSLVSRDHSVADFSESSTHRGNGRRRPSVVQDRNNSTRCENEYMNADGISKEEGDRDHDIEHVMRRRNESVCEEYERKLKEEAKIKERLSKEVKMKDDLDRRLSVSHIRLSKINPGTTRSSKLPL